MPRVWVQLQTSHVADDGRWRLVLAWPEGDRQEVIADREPRVRGERLELLAAVRALEALDEPSHVTLFTSSRYVAQGICYGLEEWRDNAWCWERYGELTPINHRDLWQRIDRALQFHTVECRTSRAAIEAGELRRTKSEWTSPAVQNSAFVRSAAMRKLNHNRSVELLAAQA
jgi:ribonuclease HI